MNTERWLGRRSEDVLLTHAVPIGTSAVVGAIVPPIIAAW